MRLALFVSIKFLICFGGLAGLVLAPAAAAQTRVIANWDMVPDQIFNAKIRVGVVAFHETGVRVEFKVNGNPLASVDDPAYNPDTRVYEYWVELDAAHYSDGPIAVSATAYPDAPEHFSRELTDLTLYANAGGALTNNTIKWADCALGNDASGDGSEANPYKTIEQAYMTVGTGGTVYLKRGNCYQITSNSPTAANYSGWTTITAAPGVARSEVLIGGYKASNGPKESGRFAENFVHWRNVTLYGDNEPGYGVVLYFESTHKIWLDGVEMYDARGRYNGTIPFGGNAGYKVYLTDAFLHDFICAGGQFMRNVNIHTIGSDIYRPDDGMVGINVAVDGIDPGPTEAHPDFLQFYNPGKIVENVIVYNNRGINLLAQGLFGQNCKDVAFVNLLLEKDPPDSPVTSQFGEVWEHILLWHVTTVDSGMLFTGDLSAKKDWNIQNNVLASLHAGPEVSIQNSVIDHNHFAALVWNQTNGPMGINATVGDPKFVSEADDDYRITTDSPAYRKGVPLPGVPADINGFLFDPIAPSLGAFEYGSEAGYAPPSPSPAPSPSPSPSPAPTLSPSPVPPHFEYLLRSKVLRRTGALQCSLLVDKAPGIGHEIQIERRNATGRRYRVTKKLLTDQHGRVRVRRLIPRRLYRCAYQNPSGALIYSKSRRGPIHGPSLSRL